MQSGRTSAAVDARRAWCSLLYFQIVLIGVAVSALPT